MIARPLARGIAIVALALAFAPPASAISARADLELASAFTSNVYLDRSQEWDIALRPAATLGLDFADCWSVGYSGDVNAYLLHSDLLSSFHELFLFANPAWGETGGNELAVEAALETLRNSDTYDALNYLRPVARARLAMEPLAWLRWQVAAEGAYRWFYDDPPSDALDTWLRGQLAFALPTHTALMPALGYGFRYYPRQSAASGDSVDQQVDVGLHVGQGLWDTAGLQLDYGYRFAIGTSALLVNKITESQFAYVGEEFFFSGHRAAAEIKQLFDFGLSLDAALLLEERAYSGWPALDASGAQLGVDRHDWRLTPRGRVGYAWSPAADAPALQPAFGALLEYALVRQWSNSEWYDTLAHSVALQLWINW
ncbi:MAG: hypothetical protein JXR83_23570 [Deltaproteobacteria bacterium]|nr:hypothetical protein [Deltaproteobacteria bacterium]